MAVHKKMISIKKAAYLISSPSYDKCPTPNRPEFVFIGRSNVGKSSIINALCLHEKLAKTSGSPGKTQLINHFEMITGVTDEKNPAHEKMLRWYLVDLPGYGFAKVSISSRRRWEQMIENYLRKRENIAQVYVLIDSRHRPQKIDLDFLDKLALWQVPFSLVFTKADKETQRVVSKNVKDFLAAMLQTHQFLPWHIVTSAVKKTGRERLLQHIIEKAEEHRDNLTDE